ncbi:PiggyBac transposable element-derived protein 4-like protein [Plakobranchus ocellatus]|uniref:PiggyBac transposable element-derived protein 4-like protein n=1 Tax=Plakobranchus ocellatus TaxID=259542 RepID=A0AAV3Y4R0_9GAST|nr:PiggyBac transposable element-derived protein 4-like protein [Plakobranchus ocellatus]
MKPVAVKDYTTNNNMAGVNHCDQMTVYYPFARQTVVWWKKLAFHTHNDPNTHTFQHLTAHTQQKNTSNFCNVCLLCTGKCSCSCPGFTTTSASQRRPTVDSHFSSPIMNGDKKVQQACIVCYAKAVAQGQAHKELKNSRKQAQYQCEPCGKALCIHPCFMIYHFKQDYTV